MADDLCGASDGSAFVGRWMGNQYVEGRDFTQQWVMDRREDGTFTIEFSINDGFTIQRQTETGTWSYANCLYKTVTLTVGGYSSHYTDAYHVRALSDAFMEYVHVASGRVYQSFRVVQ